MAKLLEYKCPSCGGALKFDSSVQKMKCPYCGTEFEMEALKNYDDILNQEQPDDMKWETQAGSEWKTGETDNMIIYTCKSCGGEIVGDQNLGATSCPFCGNPVVMMGQFSGDLRPDYVIPFKLDKQAAKDGLVKHLKGKRLLPKQFKSQNRINEIKGVYVPFWLFDADATGKVRYKATRVRAWSDEDYNYTETSYFSVYREGEIGFEKIPVDGSSKIADDLMESIEPFYFEDAVDFQTAYLAGYLADRYDVTVNQSIERANERIKHSTEENFAATVQGYSSVITESSSIQLSNGNAKYALYPVWMLSTTWNGKNYTFAMNGQTGKFVGDLPLDKGAYWRWFFSLSVIFSIIFYAIFWIAF
ncbi:DNA-directed RNA polymerase subunit P [Clostridiales bacterium CHKCI001]|nr:DNA-directed RNA polymerase subunit P [Clostridiales bacterium CHKCI001]